MFASGSFRPIAAVSVFQQSALMSIEQADVIDVVTIERGTGDVLLTISDHLQWEAAEGDHLLILQDKLNGYLRFIESGELVRKFPEASGARAIINVVGKFQPSAQGQQFLKQVGEVIESAGYELRFTLLPPH